MATSKTRKRIISVKRVLLGVFLFFIIGVLSTCVTKYYDLKLTLNAITLEFFEEKNFTVQAQTIDVIGIANYGDWHLVLGSNVNLAKIEKKLFSSGFRPPTEDSGLKCYYNGDLWIASGSCPVESKTLGPPCWVTICLKDGDKNVFIHVTAE